MEERTKHCPRCGRDLPLSAFCNASRPKDGKQAYCKDCMREVWRMRDKYLHDNPALNEHQKKRARRRAAERQAANTATEKRCSCCGRLLPLSAYAKNCYSRDGRSAQCKECTNRKARVRKQRDSAHNQI